MLKPWCMFTLIWYTFWECIKICTDLVMAQCLNFWLLVCFLRSQDWLWSNFTSIALLQGAYRRHFLASVHFHVDLIHFLWVHQDLHTPCHGPVFTSLTTCLLLARTRLFWNNVLKPWCMFMLIHFLWVHQDSHTPCHGPVFKLLTPSLLLAGTALAMKQLYKHSSTTRTRQKTLYSKRSCWLIHFLWVHQELHMPCHGAVFTFLTTCLLLARTRLAMKQLY